MTFMPDRLIEHTADLYSELTAGIFESQSLSRIHPGSYELIGFCRIGERLADGMFFGRTVTCQGGGVERPSDGSLSANIMKDI